MNNLLIPSDEYIKSKLNTKKSKKRSLRRQRAVLLSKLTREHLRLQFKDFHENELERVKAENSWKSLQ